MPGLNRRGPNGEGAMTGRRMGRCNPANKGKTDDEILQNRTCESPTRPSAVPEHKGRWGFGKGIRRFLRLRRRGRN